MVRADTPPYASRPRPPPAFRSASRDAERRSCGARAWRSAGFPTPLAFRSRGESRKGVARSGTHHLCPLPAGVAGSAEAIPRPVAWSPYSRSGRPRPQQWCLNRRSGLREVRAPGALPSPAPPPLLTLPSCGKVCGHAGTEGLGHLLTRRAGMPEGRGPLPGPRGEARPELGGLASAPPAGRLHLLSESLSHICALCGCRGGGSAGLSAIIWEDAVPCPAGAVVSPLKNPAPHCSRALQPGDCATCPRPWRKGPRPPRTPCLAAAPAGCTWRVGTAPSLRS